MDSANIQTKVPTWFWVAAGFGLIWNVFGVFQFIQSVIATRESLISMGMTDAQADLMESYPIWMTVAFAIGTFGGLVGSALLLIRRKTSVSVFVLSLVGYIVLYIGDVTEGVFAALGSKQVIILTSVVVIAAALLWLSHAFRKRGALR